MEFICVMSVEGTLLSYQVCRENENKYSATLRNANMKREDVPAAIQLEKDGTGWKADPWHPEIVSGLTQAIEASG